LRSKNIEYKAKNETIIKELENIKEDFRGLSQNFSKKTNLNNIKDTFTQTDEIKKSISSSNKTKSKSKPKIKAKKENTSNKKPVLSNNNIKPLEESTNSSKTNKSTSLDSSRSDKELIQNLKYDNSLLTQEIVNLNKELMKLRNDSKSYNETLKKIEKEKNELKTKFSSKFDNYEKIKKENEELMIMIQTSNYKTVYSIDNENKKLKDEINIIKQELENIKQETLLKEKRFKESENDFEQNKKNIEMINKFRGERENLILENTKLDSEIKKIRFEIEDIKKICEKQEIVMRNKEETIAKLTQDLNYLSISAKKSKQEAERAIQDALGFQQIVRKIEKELNDVQIKKDKAENELNMFKQQFLKNKY
jgi:chromosome segregation ATPase